MTALAADNRGLHMRRWMISAGIVMLAHAGVVSALLTWRAINTSTDTQPPIEIRLTPEPVAPAATAPAAPQPVTKALPPSPDRPTQETRESTSAATGADRTESRPSERSPLINAPVILTPEDRAQQEHDALYANHGSSGAGQPNPMSGPIDTQLANPNLRPNLGAKPNDWKKALLARRLPTSSGQRPWLRIPGAATGVARNAIGVLEGHAGAPEAETNALGILVQRGSGVAGRLGGPRLTNPPGRSVTNAIGVPIEIPTNGTGSNATRHDTNPIASAIPSQGLGLNGTRMIRPGSSTGALGGPAKAPTGGVNGSTLRPK